MLPIPQRYFVPHRIKDSYKPRLEAAGLWTLGSTSDKTDDKHGRKRDEDQEKIKRAFGQAQVRSFFVCWITDTDFALHS